MRCPMIDEFSLDWFKGAELQVEITLETSAQITNCDNKASNTKFKTV